ncbi:MAG: 50S ribosomal protein L35 [Actinomycetota bacterium]|nr:50S ribosomal protein L35 [Actinomycetota bacterium]MDD5665838.1 50S ribosomal protein L35 [Actinomycetota bacterium]
MPKMKTHRGAAKRFEVTGGGKLRRRKGYGNHLLSKKSPSRKRGYRSKAEVTGADAAAVKKMLRRG